MKRKIWLPLILSLLLSGCGDGARLPETEATPPKEPVTATVQKEAVEAAPAAAQAPAIIKMEAAQVESTARMPTEEEILNSYERAVRIYGWFDFVPLADGGESTMADGTVYRRVSAPDCGTMEELRLTLRSVFTEALTERLLAGEEGHIFYREIDGALYVTGEARERISGRGAVTAAVEQMGDTAYSVNVTVDLLDESEETVTGVECWAFPYVLENGRWGFSEFRLVY